MQETESCRASVSPKRRTLRFAIILFLGVLAITASLLVRNSRWARERQLRNMTLEELSLEARENSNDALVLAYFGGALVKAGDLRAAETAYRKAVQADSKYQPARLALGELLLKEDRLRAAYQVFQDAVKIDPKDAEAYTGVAQSVHEAGSAARAIDPLKKVVELTPGSAPAWYMLGRMYGETHQWDRAYDAIKRATDLAPKEGDYWRDLGQVSLQYGRLDEAEKQLNRAVKLKHDPVTLYLLGKLYAQRGDDRHQRGYAEAALSHAIARDPTLGPAYFELGCIYERGGSYGIAIANLRKAAKLMPEDDRALYHLGMCLVSNGQVQEGRKLIKASHDLAAARNEINNLRNRSITDPSNRDLHLRIARAYSKLEYPEGALPEYEKYLASGPRDPAVEKEARACREALSKQGEAQRRSSGARAGRR